jgi:hypothetical protein
LAGTARCAVTPRIAGGTKMKKQGGASEWIVVLSGWTILLLTKVFIKNNTIGICVDSFIITLCLLGMWIGRRDRKN